MAMMDLYGILFIINVNVYIFEIHINGIPELVTFEISPRRRERGTPLSLIYALHELWGWWKFVEHHILCHYIKVSAPEYENLPSILHTTYTNSSLMPNTLWDTKPPFSSAFITIYTEREKDPIQLQNIQE